MVMNPLISYVLLFSFLAGFITHSTSISDDVFQSHVSTGRSLLQTKTSCPENFENLNYSIVTWRCKGPNFQRIICCDAFKDLACPYAEALNEPSNDCANMLFSYLNLNGNYPSGLFSSMCYEGQKGLLCPELPPTSSPNFATKTRIVIVAMVMIMTIVFFI